MKFQKLLGLLIALFVGLGLYAWFGIIKPEQELQKETHQLLPENFPETLEAFSLTTADIDVRIEKKLEVWWVTSPQEYLANQEFVEKSLRIMKESVSNNTFKLEKDTFGFNPGKGFLRFQFAEGFETRVKVGEVEGPADTLYLLDQDSEQVYVVHNVWGQFLYYPLKQFYHPYLPLPGAIVKDMTLLKKGQVEWRVEPEDAEHLRFLYRDRSLSLPKANALWFFRQVHEFPLENLEFQKQDGFRSFWELNVNTDQGNIIFEFDEAIEKIWVKRFNVFAQVKPYSLKSLGYEIEKVFESDKK